MQSAQLQSQIRTNASATTLPILNKTKFGELVIALPPTAEQVTIATRAADQLDFCQALRSGTQDMGEDLGHLKSSMLSTTLNPEQSEAPVEL